MSEDFVSFIMKKIIKGIKILSSIATVLTFFFLLVGFWPVIISRLFGQIEVLSFNNKAIVLQNTLDRDVFPIRIELEHEDWSRSIPLLQEVEKNSISTIYIETERADPGVYLTSDHRLSPKEITDALVGKGGCLQVDFYLDDDPQLKYMKNTYSKTREEILKLQISTTSLEYLDQNITKHMYIKTVATFVDICKI